jgi:glycosyltransferase involved in cell wall biosynthesis
VKRILIYYPFKLAKEANSGSKLRPLKMIEAFKQWGQLNSVEVVIISGTSSERSDEFGKLLKDGKLENLLFCYAENQTIPLWLTDPGHLPKNATIDYKVFKYLKSKNVPSGIFYRDVYWKFDELYPLKGTKKFIMKKIYWVEERFYEKFLDVIFIPSDAMGRFVNIDRPKVSLPPGGYDKNIARIEKNKEDYKLNGIYVGGISGEDYGLNLLLNSIEIANQKQEKTIKLTIVCREEELKKQSSDLINRLKMLDVDVKHVNGEKLDNQYGEMDLAFIPRHRTEYNDFSVPVKLVEYLSSGLPVIATNCSAQQEIIESGSYGLITEDNPSSIADGILEIVKDINSYKNNINETFLEKHSWLSRAEKVKDVLLKV